jgi:hypothetical protein
LFSFGVCCCSSPSVSLFFVFFAAGQAESGRPGRSLAPDPAHLALTEAALALILVLKAALSTFSTFVF